MKIYHYSRINGEFIRDGEARLNPRDHNDPLIPAYASVVPPMAVGLNEVCIYNQNGTREIKKDFRGTKYYLKLNGIEGIIRVIGEEVPKEAVLEAPPEDFLEPEYKGNKWIDAAITLGEEIDASEIDIRDALELMFEIITNQVPAPVGFDNFKKDVKDKAKAKNFDNLNNKVKNKRK